MRMLGLSILLAVGAFAGDDTREFKSAHGWWSVQVPSAWTDESGSDPRFKEIVIFKDAEDDRFVFQVNIIEAPLSIGALAKVTVGKWRENSLGIENESEFKLNGQDAIRFEVLLEGPKGKGRLVQVLVEGGAHKALLMFGLQEPAPEGKRKLVDDAIASFRLAPAEAAPLEWKSRTIDHLGVTMELPTEEDNLTEYPDSVSIDWKRLGYHFMVECDRRAGPISELLDFEFDPHVRPGMSEPPTILSREEVSTPAGKGLRFTIRVGMEGVGPIISSALCIRAHEGETWLFMVGTLGETPPEGFKRFEEAFLEAKFARRHFAEPAKSLPELSESVEAWGGDSTIAIPAGWTSHAVKSARDRDEGPVVQGREAWAAEGAADLGVRTEHGTIEGGEEAYEAWLRKDHQNKVSPPKISEARSIQVGGREGLLWEIESGPASDRRIRREVVVFDGAEYWALRHAYPVGAAAVYAPLAERIASEVEWKR